MGRNPLYPHVTEKKKEVLFPSEAPGPPSRVIPRIIGASGELLPCPLCKDGQGEDKWTPERLAHHIETYHNIHTSVPVLVDVARNIKKTRVDLPRLGLGWRKEKPYKSLPDARQKAKELKGHGFHVAIVPLPVVTVPKTKYNIWSSELAAGEEAQFLDYSKGGA